MGNFEQEYYEHDGLWAPGALSHHDDARVRIVTAAIPADVDSLLDVGCGNGLFLNYLVTSGRSFKRLHGVDRSLTALKYVEVESSQASIESLPFEDQSFDLVTCMEVIEHLPGDIYATALNELQRIARKYVLISVPHDQDLSIGQSRCVSCHCTFNHDYHMRSFDFASMKTLLGSEFVCERVFPVGTERMLRPWAARTMERTKRALGVQPPAPPANTMCPMCGYRQPANSGAAGHGVSGEGVPGPARWLARQLVIVERPRWVAALYARR